MTYGPRNERTLERNQDNFEWQYTYDQLLRLKKQTDPNGTTRTRKYDTASRVTSLTLSTGREDIYTLDKNDNLEVIVRRVNDVAIATTSLTYDTLDRVTRVVDPHNQPVDYGFDALGRVVSVTYPGNHTLTNRYDALSRLTSQVDWAARQMSYGYDKAGRLIRRAYQNGVVQTNTFDSAGRLTGLSHSSLNPQLSTINIALTYAYDRNGNKVGNSERGTFAWPMPSLVDETSHFTASGRITNRVDALNPTNNFTYQFDPSGNMTNAAGGGQSWALKYDEDNRTTSINWDAGITSKLITNRYDALGRRIARKVDGVETRYVLDLAGGMERILCDTTASGQITAYYIHGLDLCYRVDATNNVICYHADAQANIIAVTDGGGTNVAQYAYTPYGRSLGSTNLQSQISNPYLFVGSQGVMEELPGLYFMRARYYSADAGVFLSTDPLKKIGPGWKPVAYAYADNNPITLNDPSGEVVTWGAAFLEGVGEGLVAGLVFDVGKKASEELLARAGVSRQAFEIADKLFDTGKTAYEGWKVIKVADPTLHGAASFAGNEVGGYIAGAVVNAFANARPFAQAQPFANNPITRVSSGMSPQNFAQNVQQSPLFQQTKNLVTGATPIFNGQASSGGGSSLSGRTATAGSYAQSVNAVQQTNPVGNSNGNGTTTQNISNISNGGGSSGSSGSAFTRVVNSVQQTATSVTQTVRNAATTVAQAVSSAVRSVVSTISSWFR